MVYRHGSRFFHALLYMEQNYKGMKKSVQERDKVQCTMFKFNYFASFHHHLCSARLACSCSLPPFFVWLLLWLNSNDIVKRIKFSGDLRKTEQVFHYNFEKEWLSFNLQTAASSRLIDAASKWKGQNCTLIYMEQY